MLWLMKFNVAILTMMILGEIDGFGVDGVGVNLMIFGVVDFSW